MEEVKQTCSCGCDHEYQHQCECNEHKEAEGWRDVEIHPNMPLAAIVQFFNVLNQRLCNLEDIIKITLPTGEEVSLTEAFAIRAAEEK